MQQSIASAEQRLDRLRRASAMHIETPTAHRLAKPGTSAVFGSSVRRVDIVQDGHERIEEIRVPRVRVEDDVFDRLAKTGKLDPNDEMVNQTLAAAGRRYRRDHHHAGLEGVRAMDPTSAGGTDRSSAGLLGSERKCTAFDSFSAAKRAVTWQNRAALDAILIERIDPREIGGKIGIYADKKICTALGLTFLRMALAELVLHYASADDRVRERDSALS